MITTLERLMERQLQLNRTSDFACCPECDGNGGNLESCEDCDGWGTIDIDCPECDGEGCEDCDDLGIDTADCPTCAGSLEVWVECEYCEGEGTLEAYQDLECINRTKHLLQKRYGMKMYEIRDRGIRDYWQGVVHFR